jgi:hypothetical protein
VKARRSRRERIGEGETDMIYSLMALPILDQLVVISAVLIGALGSLAIASAVIAKFIEIWKP